MSAQDPNKKEDDKTLKNRFKESLETFKKSEKVEEIYNYATANTRDTIAYVLMAVGLLLMLFDPSWYGATLVGVIFGLYFSNEIFDWVKNYSVHFERLGHVKSLILGGLLVGFFIAAPFIFIGAAVAVAARQLLAQKD